MMILTFGLFTQVSGSGPLGPLVVYLWNVLKVHVCLGWGWGWGVFADKS